MNNVKKPSSIRTLGKDQIHLDRPLKERFKELAKFNKKTQVEYLGELVEKAEKERHQAKASDHWMGAIGFPVSQSEHALIRICENLADCLTIGIAKSLPFTGETPEELNRYVSLLTAITNKEYMESKIAVLQAMVVIRQAQREQREQSKMVLNLESEGMAEA